MRLRFDKKGLSIIFAMFTLLLLSVVAVAITSIITSDIDTATGKVQSSRAFWAAEAGAQLGMQAVRDDVTAAGQTANPAENGYCGVVCIDGYEYAAGGNCLNPQYACFAIFSTGVYSYPSPADATNFAILCDVGDYVIVRNFKQRRNLIGTRVKEARIRAHVGVPLASFSELPDEAFVLQYSVDGGGNWQTVGGEKIGVGSIAPYVETLPSSIDWSRIMDINNFLLKVLYTREDTEPSTILYVDYLCLELVIEIDALSEPWAMPSQGEWGGPYINLPADIGGSSIVSIEAADESGKVHLNYATEYLLAYLLYYCGGNPARAVDIANYRGSPAMGGPFDTVEELWQVPNMTNTDFEAIKDYVTVYSWVNQDVTRSVGTRAPVNINTASRNVLRAIFRCAISSAVVNYQTIIDNLADNIINQRLNNPFTDMYSSFAWQRALGFSNDSSYLRSFACFMQKQVINGVIGQEEAYIVMANADGSFYNFNDVREVLGQNYTDQGNTTTDWSDKLVNPPAYAQNAPEFCYYTNTFLVTAVGENGGIERTVVTTYGNTYNYTAYSINNDGTLALPTRLGDSTPEPYWREVRE